MGGVGCDVILTLGMRVSEEGRGEEQGGERNEPNPCDLSQCWPHQG